MLSIEISWGHNSGSERTIPAVNKSFHPSTLNLTAVECDILGKKTGGKNN